jgi:hypothetical protein
MATSTGELCDDLVFDCPTCGVHHEGLLTITVDSEVAGTYLDLDVSHWFIRQVLGTSACRDRFVTRSILDEPEWDMQIVTYGDGRPGVLTVCPKPAHVG